MLFNETKILTGLSSVLFALAIGQLTFTNSIIALNGFSSFYAISIYSIVKRPLLFINSFVVGGDYPQV
jgi:hypothetical protein